MWTSSVGKRKTMAITREKKEEIVAKLRDIASQAKTLVFANFKGLTVKNQTDMRRALRAQEVGYTVAKKSLMRRALAEAKFDGEIPELNGEVAIVYGSDELAPAQGLLTFVKKFPEQLAFAGGMFGGKFVDKEEIASIAAIPGMQTLRAQFVNLINSPIQRFAVVLSEIAKKK